MQQSILNNNTNPLHICPLHHYHRDIICIFLISCNACLYSDTKVITFSVVRKFKLPKNNNYAVYLFGHLQILCVRNNNDCCVMVFEHTQTTRNWSVVCVVYSSLVFISHEWNSLE